MSERSVFRNLLRLKRDVREYAAEALGVVRDAPAIVPLIAALKDSGLLVRRNSSRPLSITKDRRALHALLAGAKRRDVSVVAGEYEFFIDRGEERTEDLLVRASDEYGSMLTAEDYLTSDSHTKTRQLPGLYCLTHASQYLHTVSQSNTCSMETGQ